MKNFEKHSLEEILTKADGYIHPAVADGKLFSCKGLDCRACDLHKYHEGCNSCNQEFLFWLYSEADPENEVTERCFKAVVTAWMPLPEPYKEEQK